MARKTIKSLFDRDNLLGMNENFVELYDAIGSIPENLDEDIKSIATDVAQDLLSLYNEGNLFNTYLDATTLSNMNGNENEDSNNITSSFIRVYENKEYTLGFRKIIDTKSSMLKVAFFDKNKNFISISEWFDIATNGNKTIVTEPKTAYIRVAANKISVSELFINVGNEPYFKNTDEIKDIDPRKINLFDNYNEGVTISSSSGNTFADVKQATSDFIGVDGTKKYIIGLKQIVNTQKSMYKIAYYDKDKKFISLSAWMNLAVTNNQVLSLPSNAAYARIVVNIESASKLFFNQGEIPYFNVTDNNVVEISTKPLQPYPKKLIWQTLNDSTNIKPLDLSKNGKIIYASNGLSVAQSLDEGVTWTNVGGIVNGTMVQSVRLLDDGQLLVGTTRDSKNNVKSKLFKSIGYDANNPSSTTFKEVLAMNSSDANFNNPWCLDKYINIVLASEYGGHDLTGARYVYLSTDFGETWTTIFDQNEASKTVEGAPTYTKDAHVHTCHYDRYRERIWVCVGDQDNTATYYSDDLGKTWKLIKGFTGKDTMQYTGITSYPEGVFFGSDRAPDGVYFWNELEPDKIVPFYLTERDSIRTLVYALPYRRFAEKDEVCYFVANRDDVVDGKMGPLIVGLKGAKGAKLLYDFTDDFDKFIYTDISACVGNTINDYVLVSVKDKNTGKYRMLRAKAPVWE
ncbi:WD40/YVTN/BNR-like repeat-containing protein [Staphylococcus haemolyticus]|uniref:WD40/YVTN/BNR-like repeat-containing protein n=1 Tax=Staphylococcus haemolyticus TaxID=1283 RepID=UPI0034DD5F66